MSECDCTSCTRVRSSEYWCWDRGGAPATDEDHGWARNMLAAPEPVLTHEQAMTELIRMTEDMGLYDDGTDDDEGTACNPWPSN